MLTTLHIARSGLNMFLGSIETSIMLALWAGAQTRRQIYAHISNSDVALAYPTICTVLDRMLVKGLVTKRVVTGVAYFTPVHADETTFVKACLLLILEALVTDYGLEMHEVYVGYNTEEASS